MSRHNRLLGAFVQPGDTAKQLAARFTVEAFGWPEAFEREVVAFRKLRTVAREQTARVFLARQKAHDVPSPVDLAVQEVIAAHEAELRAHVALARAWRKGGPAEEQQAAYGRAKGAHAAALTRLRRAIEEET